MFMTNLFWCVIGIVGGGVVSFYFFTLGKKNKRLSYYIDTKIFISEDANILEELNIPCDLKKVGNIYKSMVVLTNSGNDLIESIDFSVNHPLSIATDGRFFSVDKIHDGKETLGDDGKQKLEFEYLRPGSTARYIVYHSGELSISGALKDGCIVELVEAEKYIGGSDILAAIEMIIIIILFMIFVLPRIF